MESGFWYLIYQCSPSLSVTSGRRLSGLIQSCLGHWAGGIFCLVPTPSCRGNSNLLFITHFQCSSGWTEEEVWSHFQKSRALGCILQQAPPASGLGKQPGTQVTSSSRQKQKLLIGKKHLLSWLNFLLFPEFWVLKSVMEMTQCWANLCAQPKLPQGRIVSRIIYIHAFVQLGCN